MNSCRGGFDQANNNGVTIHRLEQAFEIGALSGQQFIQGLNTAFDCICQDHALYDGQALGLKEHVLGAAQTNTHRAIKNARAGHPGVVGVRPNLQTAGLAAIGQGTNTSCAQISSAQFNRVSKSTCSSSLAAIMGIWPI